MQLVIYLSLSDHWFLHSHSSNLLHKYHPKLDLEARLLSQKDLSDQDKKLLCLLYNVNVPPMTISKVLSTLKDYDVGSILPKTIFNYTEKERNAIDLAHEILPTCSDAEKTLKLLQCEYLC